MAINDISLTAGMRTNLTSLQSTVTLLNRTQERLSTGKKVNNALDNPLNFFTAQALTSRANDLSGFKDAMSEAVQTVKAANNGITAISGLIAQAKAIAASAKTTTAGTNYATEKVTIASGLTTGDTISVGGHTFTAGTDFTVSTTTATAQSLADAITAQAALSAGSVNNLYVLKTANGVITLAGTTTAAVTADVTKSMTSRDVISMSGTGTVGDTITIGGVTFTAVATTAITTGTQFTAGAGFSLTDTLNSLFASINGSSTLGAAGISAATTGSGTISLQSTSSVLTGIGASISPATSSTLAGSDAVALVASTAGDASTVGQAADRANYYTQYTDILAQINNLATDSNYKGTNLLGSDNLDVSFGSSASDKLSINGFDGTSTGLLMTTTGAWASNDSINTDVTAMDAATATLKAKSSSLSSGLSIVNTRQDWVTSMVTTLTQGADNLTLADMNEEGANMLMLQTRQALGTTALSLSSQAAQSVLKLFP
jgi:flagellin